MPLARLFDDGSSEYDEYAGAVLTAVPMTVAGWGRTDNAAGNEVLFGLARSNSDAHYMMLRFTSGGNAGWQVKEAATWKLVSSTTNFSTNTWHHLCGVDAAVNDHRIYLDAAGKATDSTSVTPVGLDRTSIGRLGRSSPIYYLSGGACHIGIWNIVLTEQQIWWLAHGRHGDGRPVLPPDIRPDALVGYWPLDGNDRDFGKFRKYHMTPYNTPSWTAGPRRLIDMGRRGVWNVPTAAGIVVLRRRMEAA